MLSLSRSSTSLSLHAGSVTNPSGVTVRSLARTYGKDVRSPSSSPRRSPRGMSEGSRPEQYAPRTQAGRGTRFERADSKGVVQRFTKPTARGWGKPAVPNANLRREDAGRYQDAPRGDAAGPEPHEEPSSSKRDPKISYQLKRFRLPPSIPSEYTPYRTSLLLRDHLRQLPTLMNKNEQAVSDLLDSLEHLVASAPKSAVSVVVWNNLLSVAGAGRAYNRMFGLFNDMKKRGIAPSVRTYTILLQHFSRTLADPTDKQISRATLIFDQSQRHIQALLASPSLSLDPATEEREIPPDDINSGPTRRDEDLSRSTILVAPTNAYLNQTRHFGRYEEMNRVFLSMPGEGRLAPDAVTYTTMFRGALEERNALWAGRKDMTAPVQIGILSAREIWAALDRQMQLKNLAAFPARGQQGETRNDTVAAEEMLDVPLATIALKALAVEGKESLPIALRLISAFGLSAPGQALTVHSSATQSSQSPLPSLRPNDATREAILKVCSSAKQPGHAAHYIDQFLEDPTFWQECTPKTVNLVLRGLADAKAPDKAIEVLRQASQQRGHGLLDRDGYIWALRAAASLNCFEDLVIIFRMMTRLPIGVEESAYNSAKPDKARSSRQFRQDHLPNSAALLLLLETAERTGSLNRMKEGMRILQYFWAEYHNGGVLVASDPTGTSGIKEAYSRPRVLTQVGKMLKTMERLGKLETSSSESLTADNALEKLRWAEIGQACASELAEKFVGGRASEGTVTRQSGMQIGKRTEASWTADRRRNTFDQEGTSSRMNRGSVSTGIYSAQPSSPRPWRAPVNATGHDGVPPSRARTWSPSNDQQHPSGVWTGGGDLRWNTRNVDPPPSSLPRDVQPADQVETRVTKRISTGRYNAGPPQRAGRELENDSYRSQRDFSRGRPETTDDQGAVGTRYDSARVTPNNNANGRYEAGPPRQTEWQSRSRPDWSGRRNFDRDEIGFGRDQGAAPDGDLNEADAGQGGQNRFENVPFRNATPRRDDQQDRDYPARPRWNLVGDTDRFRAQGAQRSPSFRPRVSSDRNDVGGSGNGNGNYADVRKSFEDSIEGRRATFGSFDGTRRQPAPYLGERSGERFTGERSAAPGRGWGLKAGN